MRLNCMPIALRFLQITAKHQDFSVLTVFLTIKTSSQNFAITLKLHEHRGDRIGEKSSLERFCKVPSAENYCWSKIGLNGVISLLRLGSHCNTDHDKFSSVVAIFLNVCLWRSNLYSNLVLTLKNCIEPPSYASMAYVVAIGSSFLFDSFIKICATCEIFLGKWLTAPSWQKISRTPMRGCKKAFWLSADSDLKTTTQDNCRLQTNVLPSEEGFNEAGFQENIPQELSVKYLK